MFRQLYMFLISFIICCDLLAQSLNVTVTNPSSIERVSETITLNLAGIFQSYPELQSKNLGIFESSKELVHQLVDENFDGVFDILIFQSSFKPNEKKNFILRQAEKYNETVSIVDGEFVLPRQDFAWENDRIAFRVYGSIIAGDVQNGIDVWTKRVRYPIIDKWYKGEEQIPKVSYHEDHGEGADYFSVGRSLGCGGTGLLWNGKLVQTGLFSFYRIITNGPIRISFELYYPNWEVNTIKYVEIKRITLDAESNMNKIEELFISNTPIDELTFAAGLVKRNNTQLKQKNGWMSLWGPTTSDSSIGNLGTAVVMGNQATVSSTEDDNNWRLSTKIKKNSLFTYYAGAGWTKSKDFNSEQEWNDYIERFATLLNQPLIITFSKSN